MRALVLALVTAAHPPVTQEEAIKFHTSGLCSMLEPGRGISRPDGVGWIVSPLPGVHRVTGIDGRTWIDFTPGKPVRIKATGPVQWCPQFVPPGRDACGPVPPAFLYDATL